MARNHYPQFRPLEAAKRAKEKAETLKNKNPSPPTFWRVIGERSKSIFRTVSFHNLTPLIISAAIATTGQHSMAIRSVALVVCALWLSISWAIYIQESDWKKLSKRYQPTVLCVGSCLLFCMAMGIIFAMKSSILEDIRDDVYDKMDIQVFVPQGTTDLSDTRLRIVNNAPHDIAGFTGECMVREMTFDDGSIVPYTKLSTGGTDFYTGKQTLSKSGGGYTSRCLQLTKPSFVSQSANLT
jgi:hypothetical protein